MSAETINLERTFKASVERVFDAWTSEEVLRRWFHGQRSWETPEAEVDLRVGGTVRVKMSDPESDKEAIGSGVYREIDRPTRLAFSWSWADDAEREMLIEVDFEELDSGETVVRFTHSNLKDAESRSNHEEGWNVCFDELEVALAATS
jgi:uncharacterized protein YndB with AHSA1/START domain